MNNNLKTSEYFECELFLEYSMPVSDVYEVLRQLKDISKKIENPIVDFIIGVDFHIQLHRRSCRCFMYLKFENQIAAKTSDFMIIFDEIFVYLPTSLPIINTIDIIFFIADFAVGAAKEFNDKNWYWYPSFYICTRMRLTYSDRIENFIFSKWREWTLYGAMVGRLVDVIDPDTFPNMLICDTLRYKKVDGVSYLINNERLEYLRGSEDFDKKLSKINLRLLGFERNYDFDSYFFPFLTEISIKYLKRWITDIDSPKILVLVGTYCCARTKVIINFIRTKLCYKIKSIFNISSTSFLYENIFLFFDFTNHGFHSIDIKTEEDRIIREQLRKEIINVLIYNIYTIKTSDNDSNINELSLFLSDNLIIYDIENDIVDFLSSSFQHNTVESFFISKQKSSS